ncbi:maleylpyruvate isomerase N-terminal domain-containing protein [Streptomyces sp. NPDC005890]|uniref:maleylpyruvate isomerase N-terminal domain-containing protein n=1 Tax=Streptomyces sp. NPDC005890 TaxID=3154568 RepID=UPI0033E2EBFB
MHKTPEFPDFLRLIDERSTAFRAAVASASGLDVQVPTCPGWTLFDLVQHLGGGQRYWAGIVAAGPADTRPPKPSPEVPREREALLAWLAESTEHLLSTLREVGPERGCWTWWGSSESPQTAGGVARHQVQEAAVHTYDAQLTLGSAQPLPDEVALDGVEATTSAWPQSPLPSTSTPPRAARGASRSRATAHGRPVSPRLSARPRTRPTPPPGARPATWSSFCTAVFRWTP